MKFKINKILIAMAICASSMASMADVMENYSPNAITVQNGLDNLGHLGLMPLDDKDLARLEGGFFGGLTANQRALIIPAIFNGIAVGGAQLSVAYYFSSGAALDTYYYIMDKLVCVGAIGAVLPNVARSNQIAYA
jgi:hypothetical protein